ncbi:hypothetical protein AMATHDRAFT_74400 [Amanita thiersii Skay4041]|uniref:SAP domain-containing protein n=1 Tax=Amanita thiersii Skay4041 TaxID=703135 RepID=A0A2A9NWK1_9AGAR|nr:hypothetical protein AMATHDRAFT_74400 [Amanita thiersii Skay4041]
MHLLHLSSPLQQVLSAYKKLSHTELVLFLKVRNLPTTGSTLDLASRLANHDLHTYHFPNVSTTPPPTTVFSSKQKRAPDLPMEILAYIMEHIGDWELAQAVGIPCCLSRPLEWQHASPSDWAIVQGYLPRIRAADLLRTPPTKVGAVLAIRFGYVHVLEYFLSQHYLLFQSLFKGDLIPINASLYGRTSILSWWKHGFEQHPTLIPPPSPGSVAEAVDGASRNGQVAALDWWLNSGHRLEYTVAALEYASAKNQIAVLEWWKTQHRERGLPLKVGRVLDMASMAGHVEVLEWWAASQIEFKHDRNALQHASCHGKVDVLDWWLASGLQLYYDQEALVGATRHNRPEVLEWWDKSGLPIQYRMCDIEEALEDAIGGGEDARAWWKQKGVDFNANDKEWMKLQSLN